jgi:tight adherence protein B
MTALLVPVLVSACVLLLLLIVRSAYQEYRETFTQTTKVTLEDMFLFIDPKKIFFVNVAVFLVAPVLVLLLTANLFLAVVVGIAALVFPRLAYSYMKKRRLEKMIEQMPDALNMLSGAMRAGASLQIAMDLVAAESPPPFSQEMSLVLREQKLGVSLEDALESFGKRVNVEDVDLMVSAISIAKDVGGNLSEILERLSATLRAKSAMEGKIRALTSQGKLQGIIVGLLPIFLGFILYQMDPVAMEPMFTTYYGWAVMAVIAVLLILGGVVIKKIVTIDV